VRLVPSGGQSGTLAQAAILSPVIQTKIEECVRGGVTYRVETTWDDESGNAEIREFTLEGQLVRLCDWRIWLEDERRGDQIGEATWFDNSGAEIERRSLRERG
jgi:hypothetical protein